MRHLFAAEGRRALERIMRMGPLLAFDFDGTLAPIVPRPESARAPEAVARRLARLATRCPVAIVTGRRVEDVRHRLGFEPEFVIGNHGAEDLSCEGSPGETAAALDVVRAHLAAHEAALATAGVTVEDKALSIALHYRLAPDPREAQRRIEQLLAGLPPQLRRFGGKCVVNVVAADAPDKGDAVAALMRRTGRRALVFLGDDENDEAVFERGGPDWLTVRIGRDNPRSRARYFLDSPAEVAILLQRMIELVEHPAQQGAAAASGLSGR